VRALSIGAVAFVSALLLAGCGKEEKQETTADQGASTQQSTTSTATTNTTATAPAPAATDNTTNTQAAAPANDQQQASAAPTEAGGKVNVYNWSDYIGEHTNENFTKATNIAVQYDVFDSNETLVA
jgi:spermidine/putrescine-binding protein